ncbi:hypothetical protein CHLRE_10g463900v5 [Chlamydomonas reinhardtii]|uniref:Uncharacterized protein n=1 Tax=Chlamydomonas reinhardtii TaxID=3055 RepID=A0A2K3DC23_CHLRE|nr:uncharacterized protein CHLRE_10g463900v5 [Chlamydomonas reinhardtii]PNW78090.1 hypothetical protein CHLRE_10g463900v5 [Chlamydomonas reinhardtii]
MRGISSCGAAPREVTPLVLQLLDEAQARSGASPHPLAAHLHIHVTEGLPAGRGDKHAGVAEESADALWGLRLRAFDHLTHMPSHTYVRVGRWADAVQANVASLAASAAASAACLPSMYPDHDAAMGVFAASMAADLQVADTYSRVLRDLPRFIRDAPASVGGQWGAPLLVWVRFAQWRQVLAAEPPPAFVFQPPLTGLGAGNATEAAGEGGNNSSTSSGGGGGGGSGIDATAAAVAADVAADPRLDPELRAAVAAAAGRGPLRGTDFTPDGVEYARVLWHFSRVMALAAEVAATEAQQAAANSTAGGVGTSAGTGASPKPMTAAQLAAAAAAGYKSATDMAAEAATVQDEQDYRQKQQAATGSSSLGSGSSSSDGGSSAAELLAGRRRALAAEWAALRAANSLVPYDVPYPPGQGLGIVVPGWRLLANVLGRMAEARLAVLSGNLAAAAEALGQAAVVEGSGGYYEPPRLGPQPARQCLGWVLLRAGRLREALQAYLGDLSQYPDNPWSVRGLHMALPPAQQQMDQFATRRDAARADADAAVARGDKAAAAAAEAEAAGLDAELTAAAPLVAAARAAAAAVSPATLTTATVLRSSCLAFSDFAK